jgi:arylsulfatase A-like enzyme
MATTGPSHATMFTSRYPSELGYLDNFHALDGSVETLAELLFAQGYETAAVVSSTPVSSQTGLNQGFTFFDESFGQEGDLRVANPARRRAAATTSRSLAWFRSRTEAEADRPYLFWVHYFDPHLPYRPPRQFSDPFLPGPAASQLEKDIALYDGDLRYTDHELGRLLEQLELENHLSNTVVVVVGDHGEGLMQRGYMSHGLMIYEETVKVPMIIRWRGTVPEGRVVTEPVDLLDLTPTVLQLAGLDPPESQRGRNLVPHLLRDQGLDPQHRIFLQRRFFAEQQVQGFQVRGDKVAVLEGSWKYLEAAEEGTRELYDLSVDPGELRNLVAEKPEVADRLAGVLQRWQQQCQSVALHASEVPADTLEKVKALGYVR